MIDGHDNRQADHKHVIVGDTMPLGGAWLLHPAWTGLPGRWVAGTLAMCVLWWGVGIWLYWGHPPRYDEFYYTFWARYWLDFDLDYLARNWPGTMIRPYLYQLFLAVIGAPIPAMLEQTFQSRIYIALVQITVYSGSVLRLAQHAQAAHGRTIGVAILAGLLALPFPVFTQVEILSESVGLALFCWFVIAAIGAVVKVRGALVIAKFATVAFLAMGLALIRAAFVPVALVAIAWSGIEVARMAARRPSGALLRVAGYVIVLAVPVVVLASPQAYLMSKHVTYVDNDPQLWGVGSDQLRWAATTAKYGTSIAPCSVGLVGFSYPMPFLSPLDLERLASTEEVSAVSRIWWFAKHPTVVGVHLFESLNHDFPTTYTTTFSNKILVFYNILSMLIISCGVITLLMAALKPRQAFNLLRRSKQNGVLFVGVIIFILWAQTGFTAVETRFGIIPWCGLAVAAAYGAITWVNEFKLGVHRWVPAGFGLVMAGSGLWISRWLLSTVDPVQRAIAAGC